MVLALMGFAVVGLLERCIYVLGRALFGEVAGELRHRDLLRWREYAARRGMRFELNAARGEVGGVRVRLDPWADHVGLLRVRVRDAARVEATTARSGELPPSLPEETRSLLAELRCPFELECAASGVTLWLTRPSDEDTDRAVAAAVSLVRPTEARAYR